jgi:hypothetical protein
VLEVQPGCPATWRERLERRGRAIAASPQGHKPCTWDDLQQLLDRCALAAAQLGMGHGAPRLPGQAWVVPPRHSAGGFWAGTARRVKALSQCGTLQE